LGELELGNCGGSVPPPDREGKEAPCLGALEFGDCGSVSAPDPEGEEALCLGEPDVGGCGGAMIWLTTMTEANNKTNNTTRHDAAVRVNLRKRPLFNIG
jgi:hypothetical protein